MSVLVEGPEKRGMNDTQESPESCQVSHWEPARSLENLEPGTNPFLPL